MPGDLGTIGPSGVASRGGHVSYGGGGLPFASARVLGRTGDDPSTLESNLRGRWARSEKPNVLHVQGNTVSDVVSDWRPIIVDRPTLLLPVQQLGGTLHYLYGRDDDRAMAQTGVTLLELAFVAYGPGVCYLHAPGRWFVHYRLLSASPTQARLIAVPCEDPAEAAAALSLPGNMAVVQANFTTNAVAGTSSEIRPANPYRKALTVINTNSPAAQVVVACGVAAVALPISTANAYILNNAVGSAVDLSGARDFRGAVNVAATVASANLSFIEVS